MKTAWRLDGLFPFPFSRMNKNFDSSALVRLKQVKAQAAAQKSFQVAANQGTVKCAPGQNSNVDASAKTDATEGGQYCCGPTVKKEQC